MLLCVCYTSIKFHCHTSSRSLLKLYYYIAQAVITLIWFHSIPLIYLIWFDSCNTIYHNIHDLQTQWLCTFMNVFLLLSLACFGILWYTIGTVIVCTYIIRVALPLAKKRKKKKSSQKLDANCICGAYVWMSIQEWLCVLWMYHFFVVNLWTIVMAVILYRKFV